MLEGQKQHLHRKSCQLSSLQTSSDTRGGKLDHEMQMRRKRECTGHRAPQDKEASHCKSARSAPPEGSHSAFKSLLRQHLL